MKDDDQFLMEFGAIKARLDNVEDHLKSVPTRPELALFTQALNNLVEVQKEQANEIKTFNDYVNRWKGAALVLVAIGAMLAKVLDIVVGLWSNHSPP